MEEFVPTTERPVLITPKAESYLVQAAESTGQDRIRIVAGLGCSGLQYKMGWDESTDKDTVLAFDKFKLILGPDTVKLMLGTVIDFVTSELGQSGFSFENPNAPVSGCSSCPKQCGSREETEDEG
ncbi:MAG: iron-sulfur cluster assembly accessory protein [Gammaproteobacteria bacterium]|nr:MAG: iron-sulfur cluster assembly accessory protein [Gammaproteobacteria bacterium]